MTREALDAMMCDNAESNCTCYESHMLKDWIASAGVYQNGSKKGRPMHLSAVQKNSLAVLTTREPGTVSDESRLIFAVFLVGEPYEGDNRQTGYVASDSKWKIELTPEEARQMLFWNYYVNPNAPLRIVFGSGLHRYLSDEQAAQILRDIAAVRRDPQDKAFAYQFFAHFCTINGIDMDSLPPAHGALVQRV